MAQAYTCFKARHARCGGDATTPPPGQSALEAIARIKQHTANAKILVFSMHQNPAFAVQATRAGALGYVTKSSSPAELIRAIQDVSAGRHSLSADIAQALALEKISGDHIALEQLTVREFEILRLLVEARPRRRLPDTAYQPQNGVELPLPDQTQAGRCE